MSAGSTYVHLDKSQNNLVNLSVLQRVDHEVEEIVCSSNHCVVYQIDKGTERWVRGVCVLFSLLLLLLLCRYSNRGLFCFCAALSLGASRFLANSFTLMCPSLLLILLLCLSTLSLSLPPYPILSLFFFSPPT